jgi:hypothetical protein
MREEAEKESKYVSVIRVMKTPLCFYGDIMELFATARSSHACGTSLKPQRTLRNTFLLFAERAKSKKSIGYHSKDRFRYPLFTKERDWIVAIDWIALLKRR